jgi:hypothetical protein
MAPPKQRAKEDKVVTRIKRPPLAADVERVIDAGDRDTGVMPSREKSSEAPGEPAREKRQAINIYVYPHQKALLDEAVRQTGISMSAYVWLAIREKMQRDG